MKLWLTAHVRVRLPGLGRMVQETCNFYCLLLLSRVWNSGRLRGAPTMRTLWTFVSTSIVSGQQITGPLQIGSNRPSTDSASGRSCALVLLVRTTLWVAST